MCACLEATLRNGITINMYLYADTSEPAQLVAHSRISYLHHRYPQQFPSTASIDAFKLPMDVTMVTPALLITAGAQLHEQWLIIAGPPCQDFSPAGGNRGSKGKPAQLLTHCVRIIATIAALYMWWRMPACNITGDRHTSGR